MAIAFVANSGVFSSGVASPPINLPGTTTAGNLLVAWIRNDRTSENGPPTMDSGWAAAITFWDATALAYTCIFYKENCGAGEATPHATNETGQTMQYQTAEFSGAETTGALDQTGSNASASSPLTATAGGTDAASGDLVLAIQYSLLSKAGTCTTTHTYNNGASTSLDASNDAVSTVEHYRHTYGITTGNASADNCQVTNSSMNLTQMTAVIASFKEPAAPPPSLVLEQGFVNFNDPGVYMQADEQRHAWHRRRSGIFVPEYAI